jgi:hypothetical protein
MGLSFHAHSISCRRGILWIRLLFIFVAIQLAGAKARGQSVEARVTSVKGLAVRYVNQHPYILARGESLSPGDEIDTGGGGRVVIGLTDGSMVVVLPYSRIVILDYRAATSLREFFRIALGRARVKINHAAGKPNPYRFNSPTASILVRGTEFGIAVEPTGDTRVAVYEGLVEVESLSDPRRRALVSPGRGALIRPNDDIRFFTPGPGSEISERGARTGGGYGANLLADQIANAGASASSSIRTYLANDYERYIGSIVEPGQSPPLLRFTAFPDSHFDTFDNPAYATEFTEIEGRLWIIPSFSRAQGANLPSFSADHSPLGPDPLSPFDSGFLAQADFFTPVARARAVVGGSVAVSDSRLQALTESPVISPPTFFFPNGVLGVRNAASSTGSTSVTGSLLAARRFGEKGRTSIGIGADYFSGGGSLHGLTSLMNNAGLNAKEELEAGSQINRLRLQFGLAHEFEGGHKLGLYYRRGLATAEDRDRSRLFNGLPLSLDSVQYEGGSSEVGFRLRGPIARRLFYGVESSYIRVNLAERIRRAVIVDSTERESIERAALGLGLGFAPRRTTTFSADFAFGMSVVHEKHFEDETGNPLEDRRQRTRFASAHLGMQTDVWRRSFVSASVLGVRQGQSTELALFPDRFGRRLTSFGLVEPDGRLYQKTTTAFSDLGVGWKFTPNLLAEYIFSINRDLGPPRHILLLRYTFRRER